MPTKTGDYSVTDGVDVLLSAIAGEGQKGHSTVFLGEDKLCSRKEVLNHNLGDGKDLRGKILVISTLVVDILSEHDRTSVLVTLKDGDTKKFPQAATATSSGTVSYLTVVRLV